MKYTLYNKYRGEYTRKLREDHIALLYEIYKQYGLNYWRSDIDGLFKDKNEKQYFLSRMQWPFNLIKTYTLSRNEKINYSSNQKQMVHYKISSSGLKILIQMGYEVKNEDIVFVARETLRN